MSVGSIGADVSSKAVVAACGVGGSRSDGRCGEQNFA